MLRNIQRSPSPLRTVIPWTIAIEMPPVQPTKVNIERVEGLLVRDYVRYVIEHALFSLHSR